MPIATEDRNLPVPIASDPDNVPSDLLALADRLKRDLSVSYGVESSRPATPSARWEAYVATDSGKFWISLGSAWTLIGPDAISPGAVGTTQLANNSVSSAKIINAAITNGLIGPKAVTWDKIADNTIGSGQLAADSVDAVRLAPAAVEPDALSASTLALLAPAPIGSLMPYGGTADPSGGRWMLCDGRTLLRATYASLFTVIGTAFGAGNGTTTFTIPNLTGRSIFGAGGGNPVGAIGGEDTHVLTINEMPAHKHGYRFANGVTGAGPDGTVQMTAGLDIATYAPANTIPDNPYSSGGGAAHNNMPPYMLANYIMRVA